MKRLAILLLAILPIIASVDASAQRRGKGTNTRTQIGVNEYPYYDFSSHHVLPEDTVGFYDVHSDTVTVFGHSVEQRDSVLDGKRVVTNAFLNNWFVFATGGAHTFVGDYSSTASFGGTISADWSVGIGKWFTPGIGLKLEFIRSRSDGYTQFLTGHYGYGPYLLTDAGIPYRKMRTSWWDISGAVIFNFSRLFMGYEGMNSPRMMNQFMGAFGFGGVHHLGFEHSHGSDNEWAGHIELQYSRFFTPKKQFSLDLKARAIFYQTNFDLEYGQATSAGLKWDSNIGIDLGFTWYLGRTRNLGWSASTTNYYTHDFTHTDVTHYRERVIYRGTDLRQTRQLKCITFYVFYPNNYSGRNDAPQVDGAPVNAIDYLAGGIFTQQRYADSNAAQRVLSSAPQLRNLATVDIPTQSASADIPTNGLPRGYEIQSDAQYCLSYPMTPSRMESFRDEVGYYYAPIWDGLHEWHYRIDKETYRQTLVNSANYRDTECFGLNSAAGDELIRAHLNVDEGDYLVSFADVYAALYGNTGYISHFTNPENVEIIKQVIDQGLFRVIEAHGIATSQDNYTGANAAAVGVKRNQELANNRAQTVIDWLMGNEKINDANTIVYVDKCAENVINPVTGNNTRGLNAKLNRCVKVRIQVIY